MYYNKLTIEGLNKCINEIFKKQKPSEFYFVVGEKTANILDLIYKRDLGIIPDNECTIKCSAIRKNAYLYPGWDYWSLPLAESISYDNYRTNEIYEEDEEDEVYYVGRLGFQNKN